MMSTFKKSVLVWMVFFWIQPDTILYAQEASSLKVIGDTEEPFPGLFSEEKEVSPEDAESFLEELLSEELIETDKLKIKWSGGIQSEVRFRVEERSVGTNEYNRAKAPVGVSRNENKFNLNLDAYYGKYSGKASLNFVWLGYPEKLDSIYDLPYREKLNPFYLETNELYIEANDFLVTGLDLRLGQQLVQWGVGDQFNPTNTLNPNDMEDVLLFGEQMGNMMLRLDYNPLGDIAVSGVLVPVFKPAQLPRSLALGAECVDRLPFIDYKLRHRMHAETALGEAMGFPTITDKLTIVQPDRTAENMQFAFRLAGTLLEQDIAISYYYGRHDFPQPIQNSTYQKFFTQEEQAQFDGLLITDTVLGYPKEQVIGLNMVGEIPLSWINPKVKGLGYRVEVGVYFPERKEMHVYKDEIVMQGFVEPAGEYDYDNDGNEGGPVPLVVDDTVFAKWVLGLDYTFGRHVYVNAMWVHGMPDEFGAGDFFNQGYVVRQGGVMCMSGLYDCARNPGPGFYPGEKCAHEYMRQRLGDYFVIGADFKLFRKDRGLFRLFFVWDITGYVEDSFDDELGRRVRKSLSPVGDGFSATIFPEFNYDFGNGFHLDIGGLIQLGEKYTKFGDPAAGGSLFYVRGTFDF